MASSSDSPLIDIRESSSGFPVSDPGPPREPFTESGDDQLITLSEGEVVPASGPGTDRPRGGGDEDSTGRGTGISWPWSKRDRLRRDPSLDKVDEDSDLAKTPSSTKEIGGGEAAGSPTRRCPDYFGVRSYLHQFYETRSPQFKDPDLYEEADDTRQLLNPSSRRRRHCTAAWWKGFVLIGVLFLLVGIVCVLVGYLLPQRPILVGMVGIDKEVIDRQAIAYNYNLDACKLIGLILFCLGGLTLAVALMIPSFLYRYCDEDRSEGGFAMPIGGCREDDTLGTLRAKDPLPTTVPTTEKLTEIQPLRRPEEGGLAKEGPAAHYFSLQ